MRKRETKKCYVDPPRSVSIEFDLSSAEIRGDLQRGEEDVEEKDEEEEGEEEVDEDGMRI